MSLGGPGNLLKGPHSWWFLCYDANITPLAFSMSIPSRQLGHDVLGVPRRHATSSTLPLIKNPTLPSTTECSNRLLGTRDDLVKGASNDCRHAPPFPLPSLCSSALSCYDGITSCAQSVACGSQAEGIKPATLGRQQDIPSRLAFSSYSRYHPHTLIMIAFVLAALAFATPALSTSLHVVNQVSLAIFQSLPPALTRFEVQVRCVPLHPDEQRQHQEQHQPRCRRNPGHGRLI
jgi:hypothetical protein